MTDFQRPSTNTQTLMVGATSVTEQLIADTVALADVTASAAELNVLAGVTAGIGAVSKALVLDASGNVIMPAAGVFGLSRAAIAAAGSDSTGATVITTQVAAVTAADGAKGVALPAAAVTEGPIIVVNTVLTSGGDLLVYPVDGGNDNINALAEDAPFTVGPGKVAIFIPTSAAQWYVEDLAGVTATTTELNLVDAAPASIGLTPAAGGANVCEVTIQVKDAAGASLAGVFTLHVWLSDAATGVGLTGTDASGTVQAKTASGTDLGALTAKEALVVQTLADGSYILEITDSAKTGYYVGVSLPLTGKAAVSAQLVAGNYGT